MLTGRLGDHVGSTAEVARARGTSSLAASVVQRELELLRPDVAVGHAPRLPRRCSRHRDVINLLLVGIEKAVVFLGGGPGLLVLIEESEQIDVKRFVGPQGGPTPTGLGNHHLNVAEVDGVHGGEHGVELRLEQAFVNKSIISIHHAFIISKQSVIERNRVGIRFISEEGLRFERTGGGRVRGLQRAERDGGGDFDGGSDAVFGQRSINVFHSRDEVRGSVRRIHKHFIADGDGVDYRLIRYDVGLDPPVGERLASRGGGELLVRKCNRSGYTRPG
nr:hypothetical protein Iba_chr01dCG6700 [Ipomoea batatas]